MSSFGYSGTIAHGAFCDGQSIESDECGSSVSLYRARLMRSECSVNLIRRVALSRGRRNHQNISRRELQSLLYCREQTLTLLSKHQMRPRVASYTAIGQTIEQSQLVFEYAGCGFSETDILVRQGRFATKMPWEVCFDLTGYLSIVLGVAKSICGDMDG